MHALLHAPLQSRPKGNAVRSPITQHHSQPATPGDPTPGTSYHNARPPDLPPGLPCLEANRMCVCLGVLLHLLSAHACVYLLLAKSVFYTAIWASVVRVQASNKATCMYVWNSVFLSVWRGRGERSSDKLPHLVRFRRSERSCGEAFISETEKKGQNQDGVSVKEDEKVERVGEDRREGGKDWDKEWKR